MPGLLDFLGFGGTPDPTQPPASAGAGSQDWATSLLNDPSTQGLLDMKLPPMESDSQRRLRSISAGLGNVAKTMAQIGASGRPVGIGATLGAAGAAFGEGLTDTEAERYKDLLQRYQLAKQRGDIVAQQALAREYLDMKKQIDGARGVGPGADTAVAPAGPPSDLAGAGPVGGPGAAGTAGPPGAPGQEPMITLSSGTRVPLKVAQGWAATGSPEAFAKAKNDYLQKVATGAEWVDIPAPPGAPADAFYQQNITTGEKRAVDKGVHVNVNQQTMTGTKRGDELMKIDLEDVNNRQKDLSSQAGLIPAFQMLDAGLKGGWQSGGFKQALLPLRQALNAAGFDAGSTKDDELMSSAIKWIIPRMKVAASGSSSDKDINLFAGAAPNMMNSPEGNRLIVKGYMQIYNYRLRELNAQKRWLRDHDDLADFPDQYAQKVGPAFNVFQSDDEYKKAVDGGRLNQGDVYYDAVSGHWRIFGEKATQ